MHGFLVTGRPLSESTSESNRVRRRQRTVAEDASGRSKLGLIASLVAAPAIWSIAWPALLLLSGYAAWQWWGAEHVATKYYGVDVSAITVSPPPPDFVRGNIVESVYRDTGMETLSLLDRQACAKVGAAFGSHPWVQRVMSVRKQSNGALEVRLAYREPVAMVDVISRHPELDGVGCFAVDGAGVLLPPSDFSESETLDFIHIQARGAYPTGGIGTPFGDARIAAAAKLAELLHPFRNELDLHSIGVYGDLRTNPIVQLELATQDKDLFFWGSPPGEEVHGEPPAKMKLDTLLGGVSAGSDLRRIYVSAPQ